jgi:hypothetical protein
MKYFMLLGGFTGFIIAIASGLFAGSELSQVVFNSSVGCIFGAYLFRLFRKVVASSVREVALQKSRNPRPNIAST